MKTSSPGLDRVPPDGEPDEPDPTEWALPVAPPPASAPPPSSLRRSRERPAIDASSAQDPMIGREVDHYRILGHIGGGGMGVVYKAEDSRLQRIVALKFLPPALTRDEVAKSRFLQEARAASALDHPNVCTIFDIGETEDGQLYLAMPAYDGETVKKKIERGPLPIEEVVDIARQVAQGLAKAHQLGIVHRDIKPPNLVVTSDGIVKILDFGLAKLAGSAGLTRAGFCVGTPSYMSPEQARGEVDHRTDLWSLGVVLYEMLTGLLPFHAESDPGVVHAVLHDVPAPLARWRPEAPAALQDVVEGLLQKDPGNRYPTAEHVLAGLRSVGEASARQIPPASPGLPGSPALAPAARPRRPPVWAVAAAALALAMLAAGVAFVIRRAPGAGGPSQDGRVKLLTRQEGSERQPSLVGKFFAYAKEAGGDFDIFLQRVDGDNPLNLTEDCAQDDMDPAISPDGRLIVFRSECDGAGLFLMGLTGESKVRLSPYGHSPAWSPDGTEVVFATQAVTDPAMRVSDSELWRIPAAGGEPRILVSEDAAQPSWSPHGRRIAYWSFSSSTGQRALWTVGRDGGDPVRVLADASLSWSPVWSADGRQLYFLSDRGGSRNLWRVQIDEPSGQTQGDPVALGAPSESIASFGRDGDRIIYSTLDSRANVERIAFDPGTGAATGTYESVVGGSWAVRTAEVSPDGRWLAFDTVVPQEDLFVVRADGTGLRQLTDDAFKDRGPRWSPDGSSLVFFSNRSGKYEAWRIRAAGGGLERLTRTAEAVFSPILAPDGRRLSFNYGFIGAVLVDLREPIERRRPRRLELRGIEGKGANFAADSWSPEGGRLAGLHGDGVAVYSFATGGLRKLSDHNGHVLWLRDGQRLLYLDQGRLRLADLASGLTREVLAPPQRSDFQWVSASADDRMLYLVRHQDEGGIWTMSLK